MHSQHFHSGLNSEVWCHFDVWHVKGMGFAPLRQRKPFIYFVWKKVSVLVNLSCKMPVTAMYEARKLNKTACVRHGYAYGLVVRCSVL